jgi:hypothetical protein
MFWRSDEMSVKAEVVMNGGVCGKTAGGETG